MFIPLLIIQVITFLLLVLVLRTLFYRNLKSALDRLNTLHEENLVKEEQLKKELERGRLERVAEVGKGKAEAKAIIEDAKKQINNIKSKLEKEARQQADEIIQRAEQESAKLKQNILAGVEKEALELSAEMVKSTFTSKGKENLQQHLIDEVIHEVSALSKERFNVNTNKVKVSSAFSLTAAEKDNIKKILSEKMNSSVVLEEDINPELITGLILEIGALVIDGSLKNRLSRAYTYLKGNR
jgi:F0F1-type ATP synthase membrane subunit b/b'